jgi:hypothetical protein
MITLCHDYDVRLVKHSHHDPTTVVNFKNFCILCLAPCSAPACVAALRACRILEIDCKLSLFSVALAIAQGVRALQYQVEVDGAYHAFGPSSPWLGDTHTRGTRQITAITHIPK